MTRNLAIVILIAACGGSASTADEIPREEEREGEPPPETPMPLEDLSEAPEGTSLAALAEARRTPDAFLVFGQDYPARPAPSLEDTRANLRDESGEPNALFTALAATGMDPTEIEETVFAVAGHNSGQAYDPVRQQADAYRSEMQGAVDAFLEELDAQELPPFDREALQEAGVVLGWEPLQ